MNTVFLIGNLATDVDLREVGEGTKVASFLLAVDRPTSDDADFVRISAWERQAEICGEYLTKGRQVAVEGRLRSSSWEDEDGKRHTAVEVRAGRVQFLAKPERQAADVPAEEVAMA